MKLLLVLSCFLISACVRPQVDTSQYSPAASIIEQDVKHEYPKTPATGKFVYSDSPDIQKATEEFLEKGRAPIIRKPGFEIYPYEESEPLLHCQPLRACDVELEAGEEILGIALGDPVRWDLQTIYSGSKDKLIPHVIVKPKDFELTTNMVISTTSRTYHMALMSSDKEYARRFKFYYPREFVSIAASREAIANKKEQEEARNTISELPSVSADKINFSYNIDADSSISWRPVRVFDDGVHVYIQMPQIMKTTDAPILMIKQNQTNSASMVNYRVKKNYYVVDRLFNEAMLLLGVGDHQEKVTITKNL